MRHESVLLHLLFMIALVGPLISVTTEELYKGVVTLDELTFDKVASRFRYVLVKFDHPYPYGVDHENYVSFGKQLAQLKRTDVITVNLEVKDYAEQDSQAIAKRYQVDKEQFPAIRLFINPPNLRVDEFVQLKPLAYEEERNESANNKIILDAVNMRLFFWRKTGIRAALPNCTEDLDALAAQFLDNMSADRKPAAQKIIDKVAKMAEKSSELKRKSAKVYLKFMQKGLERGSLFYESEQARIGTLLVSNTEKMTIEKRKQLQVNQNVLQSFRLDKYPKEVPDPQLKAAKESAKEAARKAAEKAKADAEAADKAQAQTKSEL